MRKTSRDEVPADLQSCCEDPNVTAITDQSSPEDRKS